MAFRINMDEFGKAEVKEKNVEPARPIENEIVDDIQNDEVQENDADTIVELAPEETSDFVLGDEEDTSEVNEIPVMPTSTPVEPTIHEEKRVAPPKKTFEGVNKDVLAITKEEPEEDLLLDNLDEIPVINLEVAEEQESLNEEKATENILKRQEQQAMALLEEEIAKGQQLVSKPAEPIKVMMIGGNEQYYKTTLANLNVQYPDVSFIKYFNVGGKNAFYTIDSLNPDIIFMYYNASIQNALAFHEAVATEIDDNGVPYAKKYADKRLVVLAPNDFRYEMELREKGINYYITENNSRTHTVEIPKLIEIIRHAYQNIEEAREMRERALVSHAAPAYSAQPEMVQAQPTEAEQYMQKHEEVNYNEQVNAMPIRKHREVGIKPQEIAPHEIIGVYSATGGAGITTFATNLAAILAKYSNIDKQNDYRVCLLEYNLVCRNIDLFFNIKNDDKTVANLAKEVGDLYTDESDGRVKCTPEQMAPIISRYIYKHEETGLDILSGISIPLEIDRLRKGFTNCLFNTLREMYDVVIVDMSADIAKTPMLEAFNNTDKFYYVMPMDVPSIRNTRVLVRFLTGMFKKPADSIKIILNKVNLDNEEFGVDQVYKALASDNCVPEGTIPDLEHDVRSSINRGIPLALENIEHPISQALFSIAVGINPMLNAGELEQVVAEEEEKKKASGGLFGKLFKSKSKEDKKDKEPKKKKASGGLFGKKKAKVEESEMVEEETIKAPAKTKKSFGFGKKKRAVEEESLPALPDEEMMEEPVEKPEKKGLFAKFFGGKKKADKKPAIANKKKFGGLLGKGKGKSEEVVEETAETGATPARSSRLRSASAGRRPRRR